jgi:hypothetical protein
MSEGLKDAIYVKDSLFFLGFVDLQIEMCTDASDARAFVHRLGVGRMHHLDVRLCYLKYQQKLGVFVCSKVPIVGNPADMCTHPSIAAELAKFQPKIGFYPYACRVDPAAILQNILRSRSQDGPKIVQLLNGI